MPLTEPAGVYRLFEEHFERYVREYEERYEPREGSLRKVVPTALEAYLACGRPEGGFARIRCPNCRAERLSEEFQRSLLGWVHSGFPCTANGRYRPRTSRVPSTSRAT